ncbi:6,7-dimethyl-8-ribityllumazine synthase [Pyrodictium delaneyi]|uniref:6,7-dimethyl-8-ribityllumazine synthase n=1 Tax=Pyrodictium delaneyi TaxID=1273541 RepID=A0A0P0N6U9_9CREN|nr:6,7-dimethyl-8-ribityllumazine synthase [Pyrodictium delaneyi]ALL02044.1 6,7-dimethyl-8-ribityllumazine synthase [Pyrodictium delaneyi]
MAAGEGIRLAIVVSEFNHDVTYLMLQRALSHAKFLGATVTYVVRAPGAYDIPLLVEKLLRKDDVDAVVALGAIITGATKHDEVIAHQVARKLVDLAEKYGKPVTLGISGPGMNRMQALERVDDYARRSVEAAVKLVRRLRAIEEAKFEGETVYIE